MHPVEMLNGDSSVSEVITSEQVSELLYLLREIDGSILFLIGMCGGVVMGYIFFREAFLWGR